MAKVIQATLKVRGWTERELSRATEGSTNTISHGTANRYAKGRVVEPTEQVLEAIAPFIYRLIAINGDDIELDLERTYEDDWEEFAKIGSSEFAGNSNAH